MKSRHKAREIALQVLYQYDLKPPVTDQELIASLNSHFEHFSVPESLREFAAQLVAGTLKEKTALDSLLEKHASNWKVARMSSVDRSLLRMAAYEMLQIREINPSIVIDEAIELAKEFGTSDTPGFVNGILDSIQNELKTAS